MEKQPELVKQLDGSPPVRGRGLKLNKMADAAANGNGRPPCGGAD